MMAIRSFGIIIALSLATSVSAQTKAPHAVPDTIRMDLASTEAIRSVLGNDFDEGHIAMLQALGHQQAVATTCSGFEIDPKAFSTEFDLIYDDSTGKPRDLEAADRVDIERKATLAMGMAFGAQIAISANDHQTFCEVAAQERMNGKAVHLIWVK